MKRTGDAMKTIRKYVYVAALAFSALSLTPSPASGQDAAGRFTLTHEVRWQNAIVPAGEYRFTVGPAGTRDLLTLQKVNSPAAGFMLMVRDKDGSKPSDTSELVVVSRRGGSYVSVMQLPEFGMTLHFSVPAETREMAKSVATTTASAAR
jgi:hypothetical protein